MMENKEEFCTVLVISADAPADSAAASELRKRLEQFRLPSHIRNTLQEGYGRIRVLSAEGPDAAEAEESSQWLAVVCSPRFKDSETAMDLIRRYGAIAEIYRDLSALDVKDGVRKKLDAGRDSANSSYWLATIFREVPLDCGGADCFRWRLERSPELLAFMKRLGFRRMIEQWRLQELEENAENSGTVRNGQEKR